MKKALLSPLCAVLALAVFSVAPVLAQDYGAPSGYGAPANIPTGPSADQIQQMQQQAMREAQGQVPANMPPGVSGGVPAAAQAAQERGEEMERQGAVKQLQGLKAGARGMENGLKQFESLVKKAEQAGGGVSAAIKEKYNQLKANIAKIKTAKTADEIGDIDTDSLQSDINEVMESAGQAIQNAQQLKGLKQGITGMERGLKAFETQLARITKQKVAIPVEIMEKVGSIKSKIAAVKTAKTWDEAEAAGVEELQDSMESLNDYRDELEVLVRLPQIQRQLDQQMARLNAEVKKTAALVAKMKKQGIDLAEEQAAFTAAVNQLKIVRDTALAQVKSGNMEGAKTALDEIEDNFFGQITDVMEHSRIIQTMAGLSRFPIELKRNLTAAQTQINQLKRKRVNTAELESLLNQAKAKGAEVAALIKVKPLDEDAAMDAISALEDLRTQFDDKAVELGGGAAMPWEGGAQQFKAVANYDIDKYLPKK